MGRYWLHLGRRRWRRQKNRRLVAGGSSVSSFLPMAPVVAIWPAAAIIAEANANKRRSDEHRRTIGDHWTGRGIDNRSGRRVNDRRLSYRRVRVCIAVARRGVIDRSRCGIIDRARCEGLADDHAGRDTRQNLSRSGPSAAASRGSLYTCSGDCQSRESQNHLLHNLPFSVYYNRHR